MMYLNLLADHHLINSHVIGNVQFVHHPIRRKYRLVVVMSCVIIVRFEALKINKSVHFANDLLLRRIYEEFSEEFGYALPVFSRQKIAQFRSSFDLVFILTPYNEVLLMTSSMTSLMKTIKPEPTKKN